MHYVNRKFQLSFPVLVRDLILYLPVFLLFLLSSSFFFLSFFHHSSVYPEYSARVQSVIPSMTSSQSEHRRSHSLSGWFFHPFWRNTSRKKEKSFFQVFLQPKFKSVSALPLSAVGFGLHLMISRFLFNNWLPLLQLLILSFCFTSSLLCIFSVIIGFEEQRRHHQTNHRFLSSYTLTLYFCLFWVAVLFFKVRELPQMWRRKNPIG